MSKPVNLRAARKQAERVRARAEADVNAARHGESKTGKASRRAQTQKAQRQLDLHQRERGE